jgi:cation transport ATPase
VTLFIIVGLPILIVFCIAKKNNVGFNEPLIQPKNYTPEEQENEKKKSYAVAKRVVLMSNLSYISLNQTLIALVLFLVSFMGISAVANIADKRMLSFMMSGGCFLVICFVCMIIFAVTGIWAAIGYKRLEIMCTHMGSGLYLFCCKYALLIWSNRNLKRSESA